MLAVESIFFAIFMILKLVVIFVQNRKVYFVQVFSIILVMIAQEYINKFLYFDTPYLFFCSHVVILIFKAS